MQDNNTSKNERIYHFSIFMLFLICGLLVFFINMTFRDLITQKGGIILNIYLMAMFFTSAILLRRNKRLSRYWEICFAFFIVSIAVFLSPYVSNLGLSIFSLEKNTLNGFTLYKFLEDSLIILCIIVLIRVSGGDMASIYLKKGNLKLGLIIGLTSFLLLSSLSVMQATTQNIGYEKLISLTPWILVIVLGDGFMGCLFRQLLLLSRRP